MTKDELKDIARKGVRNVLLDFEEQLATIFHEFPEAFVSDVTPVIARPELRNGHGGARVAGVSTKDKLTRKMTKKSRLYGRTAAVTARRQKSFDMLEVVAQAARPLTLDEFTKDQRAALPLIRRGYLKKSGKGYVRTAKVFYVKKSEAEKASRAKRA